ncbi:MAG: hypothetical protein AAF411_23755, partial [Myxococcota bacterium]
MYIELLTTQLERFSSDAQQVVNAFDAQAASTLAHVRLEAFTKRGTAYEHVAHEARGLVANVPLVFPTQVAAALSGQTLTKSARRTLRLQISSSVQTSVAAQTAPIECLAIAQYALAARTARISGATGSYLTYALRRLQAYSEPRVAECVSEAAEEHPLLLGHVRGEFHTPTVNV